METSTPFGAEPLVLNSIDYVWGRVWQRLEGLSQDEYLWEPAPGMWSIRRHDGGVWRAERVFPDPEPAPVTSIAWRLWHIGADCLAGYTANGLGAWPLSVEEREWFDHVEDALAALDTAWAAFRAGLGALGEEGMRGRLGEAWGPYAADSWASLVIHALDEIAHHGAEIALLRDLYSWCAPRVSTRGSRGWT